MKAFLFAVLFLSLSISSYSQCFLDRHNTSSNEGWISCEMTPNPIVEYGKTHWIMYDFGDIYLLGESHLWNNNVPGHTDIGINEITIDISFDGEVWYNQGNFSIEAGPASAFYEGIPGPDLSGVKARFLLITVLSNHGSECAGFSEIRIETEGLTTSTNDDLTLDVEVSLFPNPAKEIIQFEIRDELGELYEIKIYDASGRLVFEDLVTGRSENTISVKAFAAGMYHLTISKGNRKMAKNFAKID